MYERLHQLINDLESMKKEPFIGYGNPDAKILIVGKECADQENSNNWNLFFKPNFKQWRDSFNTHGFGFKDNDGLSTYNFDNHYFHPIFPYYRQHHTMSQKDNRHTSQTWYYYQRLVDMIRVGNANERIKDKERWIDFFNDCFITELNDICRPNNKGIGKNGLGKETERHIRERFDWMRKTNFFNQFQVVILACGPYADAIKKDEILKKDLFGEAYVVYCGQLSRWDKRLEEKIPEIYKRLHF